MIPRELVDRVRSGFALPHDSIHGWAHWARVLENGFRLAADTGAHAEVVELFSLLHDCKRLSDQTDLGHGRRAAEFARSQRGLCILLSDEDFELLAFACEYHTDGLVEANVTVQTCWDADRLDLGRVGILPEPGRLCTAAAKELGVLKWAIRRSQEHGVVRLDAECFRG